MHYLGRQVLCTFLSDSFLAFVDSWVTSALHHKFFGKRILHWRLEVGHVPEACIALARKGGGPAPELLSGPESNGEKPGLMSASFLISSAFTTSLSRPSPGPLSFLCNRPREPLETLRLMYVRAV